ncbi:hypothetical protein C0995_001492 [Termitomyces sp. Mi166|nr:hypothetical protein C0995_001492 [Termitomyces sp. Mi166\
MSTALGTAHQGIWMENGSGGFMGDLVLNGGKYGLWVGNQQFTIGFDFLLGVSAVSIVDAIIRDTPIAVRSAAASSAAPAGSLILDNMRLHNVTIAVADSNGTKILQGGPSIIIKSWGQSNVYSGSNSSGTLVQGPIIGTPKPSVLLDNAGRIFGKTHPQYTDYSVQQFVSAKDHGARGDGQTDDTAALQSLLYKSAGRKIVFFDAGTYIVTSTLVVPVGTRMVGEAWSVIAGKGKLFFDQENPEVVVRVGERYSCGVVEITDMIFTTVGPAPGAIVVEWNVREPEWHQGGAGMWDSHVSVILLIYQEAAGTELELVNCPPGARNTTPCMAAFLALHLTPGSSAYLEVYSVEFVLSFHKLKVVSQGTWVWLADHDLDGDGASQISIYSGRGILSESEGPPYWQPVPPAPEPFATDCAFKNPDFSETDISAWALSVEASENIIVFGAGLYSFFQNYSQVCLNNRDCQTRIINVDADSSISIYSLSTVASTYQISVDGVGIVEQSDNVNGFVSTVAFWTSSRKSQPSGGIEVHIGLEI